MTREQFENFINAMMMHDISIEDTRRVTKNDDDRRNSQGIKKIRREKENAINEGKFEDIEESEEK